MSITSYLFQTKPVRQSGTADDPWFCASDVCACLNIRNPSQKVANIDASNKQYLPLESGRTAVFLNEAGLYEAIFSTRRSPVARQFQQWVFSEVLPAIRRTGRYEMNSQTMMQLQDRDSKLVHLALTHFSDDDQLRLLAREKLQQLLGNGGTTVASVPQLLPIAVALEMDGQYSSHVIAKFRARIGRHVAKLFRELCGEEPKKIVQNVHGRPTRVNAFDQAELERLLPEAKAHLSRLSSVETTNRVR